MLVVENLGKSFTNGKSIKPILHNISFTIEKGTWLSIMGPSGVGKSTLLNCLSGINKPDKGTVQIQNQDIYQLNEKQLSDFRRKKIGFVFQDFKLLPHYSVLDNVTLPLLYDESRIKLENRAKDLLHKVGIDEHLFMRLPASLSGGEKQRVAIARSMIAEPNLLLCDEPTGNLDRENRNHITDILVELKQQGQTIIVVTHDDEVANCGDICYQLNDGSLREVVMTS